MTDIAIASAVLLGCFFVFLASVGVLRFKDLYIRMHAATKAGALGGAILVLAGGLASDSSATWALTALMKFFYSTMPVAAHLIALAAYQSGVQPVKETKGRPTTL